MGGNCFFVTCLISLAYDTTCCCCIAVFLVEPLLGGISRHSVTVSVLLVSCQGLPRSLETYANIFVFVYLSNSEVRRVQSRPTLLCSVDRLFLSFS
jgi:hypothetical protein